MKFVRRDFLKGTLFTGLASATSLGGTTRLALAVPSNVEQQLSAIISSPQAKAYNSALADILLGPAAAAINSDVINDPSDLSSFQLQLALVAKAAFDRSAALKAQVSGSPLTASQKKQLQDLAVIYKHNPSIQLIINAGHLLKSTNGLSILEGYLAQDVAALSAPPLAPVTLPSANDNLVNQQLFALQQSTAAIILSSQYSSLMQRSDFPTFVQDQPPLFAASFIPLDVLSSFQLPNDAPDSFVDGVLLLIIVIIFTLLVANAFANSNLNLQNFLNWFVNQFTAHASTTCPPSNGSSSSSTSPCLTPP